MDDIGIQTQNGVVSIADNDETQQQKAVFDYEVHKHLFNTNLVDMQLTCFNPYKHIFTSKEKTTSPIELMACLPIAFNYKSGGCFKKKLL